MAGRLQHSNRAYGFRCIRDAGPFFLLQLCSSSLPRAVWCVEYVSPGGTNWKQRDCSDNEKDFGVVADREN